MADNPARRGFGSPDEGPDQGDPGWGSPMPAEYGSLAAFLPPVSDPWGTPAVREAADAPPDGPPRAAPVRPGTRRPGRLARRLRQVVNPPGAPRPAPVDEEARSAEPAAGVDPTGLGPGGDGPGRPDPGDPGEGPVDRGRRGWFAPVGRWSQPAGEEGGPAVADPATRGESADAADPGDGWRAPGEARLVRTDEPDPDVEPGPGSDLGLGSDVDPGPEPEADPVRAYRPRRRERPAGPGGAGSMGAYGVDPVIDRDDDAAGAWSDEGQEDHVFDRGGDEYQPDPAGGSRPGYGGGGGLGPGAGMSPLGMAAVPAGVGGPVEAGPPLRTYRESGDLSRRQRRRDRRWVETRWVIRHLDIWTVIKVSVIFYLIVLVAVVVASVLLWYLADSFGALHSIEKSVKTLFDLKTFTLHPKTVAVWTAAGGAALAVGGTIANVLAALVYNLISDLVGGISARVVTEAE